jgi:hypothetical protein
MKHREGGAKKPEKLIWFKSAASSFDFYKVSAVPFR